MNKEQNTQKANQDLADAMREIYDALTLASLNERLGTDPAFKELADKNNRAMLKILTARKALGFDKISDNE
jgi:hypothetical protein